MPAAEHFTALNLMPDLSPTASAPSRGRFEKLQRSMTNGELRRSIAGDLTREVALCREQRRPLDQPTVEGLVQQNILLDLSDLMSALAETTEPKHAAQHHFALNEKLKAMSAWRSSSKALGKVVPTEDLLSEFEKEKTAAKARLA